MPAVNLPWTEVDHSTGVAPAAEVTGDTVNGHVALNDGAVEIIVRNADGAAPHNVTFTFPAVLVDGQAVTSRTVAIPLSSTRKFFGFPPALFPTITMTVDSTQLKLSAEHKVDVRS